MIVIIDYHMGNVGSIQNMLRKIGIDSMISSNPNEIENADKIILPGVGAFDTGMKNLAELDLLDLLKEKVQKNSTPTLGICLGMQLITKTSEEGTLSGLGWIDAITQKFQFGFTQNILKIPHMGWNTISIQRKDHLLKNLDNNSRFYFVHSYHVKCNNPEDVLATTFHGYDFVSIFKKNNIIGTQFHPEKSHRFGMTLLKNFTELS